MYLTSEGELRKALGERERRRQEIRERTSAFLDCEYGVSNAPSIIPPYVKAAGPVAVLARQVPSVSAEDVAFTIGARVLGLVPLTAGFSRDTFNPGNEDKLHRLCIPWVEHRLDGSRSIAHERLCSDSFDSLSGVPLRNIRCMNGLPLFVHHRNLREAFRLPGWTSDATSFHKEMLQKSVRRPELVYRIEEGRERLTALAHGADLHDEDRPPASWYYPYYLSCFLDGTAVLFETYDSPNPAVSAARDLFENAVRRVRHATGYAPLVVKVPPLTKELLSCNRHLLWRNDGILKLEEGAAALPLTDSVSFFGRIAESVLAFH
jgi:hypothetical protein